MGSAFYQTISPWSQRLHESSHDSQAVIGMRRKVLLCLVFLSVCVVFLEYFVLKKINLSVYDAFYLAGPQLKSLASSIVYVNSTTNDTNQQQLTQSGHVQNRSELREFESPLDDKRQCMGNLMRSETSGTVPKVEVVNCSKIWRNDMQELNAARQYQQSHGRQPAKDVRHYLQNTLNCTSYFLTEGFHLAKVDENELSFPLAFSLVVHRDVEQVERLLRAVYRPHNVYCITPDWKASDNFHSSLRFIAGCIPNVKILERPLTIEWGKYSVLEADVECMRLLWRHPTKWRYFINLTGQEFPLKTNKEIVRILQALNGANDISGCHDGIYNFRFEKFLPAPYNITISIGSVHVIASRGYVDYAINSRVGREFYKWVSPTFIPDEIFFSTLNHNPKLGVPGSYTGDPGDKRRHFYRYKVWLYGVSNYTGVCDGKNVRGVCHFGLGDLPRLVVAPQLFANKFSYDFMPLAYDCLEEWYWHKVHLENVGRAQELNLTAYQTSDTVLKRYDGPVTIWE